jgi:predicted lactoylglutathione lyase
LPHGIGHNVAPDVEVDEVMRQAANAGASIVKAQKTSGAGTLVISRTPDGHLWEVAWNPAWTLPEQGMAIRC